MAKNKKTKIKGGYFHNGKGKQFTVLQDALANDTKCGCGINCKDGFVSLPSFDSVSGDKEGFHGFYFVDGELVTDTVQNIKEDIKSFCNGGGQEPQEPQALRLTFDSIENANTLVGDASDVNDWNTFFDLPTYGNPFTSVEVVGNEVRLFGGSNIVLRDYLFDYDGNASLLEFNDLAGCIISSGYFVFGGWDYGSCINLATLILPSIIDAKTFQELSSLTIFSAPLLEILGDNTANGNGLLQCTSLTTVDLPSLTTAGQYCFSNCTSLTTINIPSCTDLGGSVSVNNVFNGIIGNTITLTVSPGLMTCNSGSPDGDIQYLQANNTVILVVLDDNALNLVFDTIANADLLVGDASVVGDWNTFFDLPTYGTPFSAVTISGETVQLFGGSGIKVKPGLMYYAPSKSSLIEVIDNDGCITSIGGDAFSYEESLTTISFPACTIVYDRYDSPFDDTSGLGSVYALTSVNMPSLITAQEYTFSEAQALQTLYLPSLVTAGQSFASVCTLLETVNLPNLINLASNSFGYCTSLTTINLPSLTTAGQSCFASCTSLATINIPSCTDLGGTVGNDTVFGGINGNTITLTIPTALMTADSGSPDGDIAYLQANNTVTVITV